MKRTLAPIGVALLIALGSAQSVAAAPPAGGGSSFTLSPNPFSITAAVGWYASGLVTVSTTKSVALAGPATSSDPHFDDINGGTCWSQYLAHGQKIPANVVCSISIRFFSATAGTFTGTLSVSECTKWHLGPTGAIVCDKAAAPQRIGLTATAMTGLPDMTVLGVNFDVVGPNGPADYLVALINQGWHQTEGPLWVDLYLSADNVLDDGDVAVASTVVNPGIPPAGAGWTVLLNGSTDPTPTDLYLIVELDHGRMVEDSNRDNNIFVTPLPPH